MINCKRLAFALIGLAFACKSPKEIVVDVLVIGGGTSGTAAGIASARTGAATLLAEEGPWLGGMISAAGVTCTDGNHDLPSGIWGEFREHIYKHYGGPQAVATGWVSNTQFEPHVSDSIWKYMAAGEQILTVKHGWQLTQVLTAANNIKGAVFIDKANGEKITVLAKVTIDATELGDAMAMAKVPYDLGMEAGSITGEDVGVDDSSDIVQDLTYVAILKDYGPAADCTIAIPKGYTPTEFDGCCTDYYLDTSKPKPSVDAKKMLDYGKMPNDKYMINWPNAGNDTYLNIVESTPEERVKALQEAKATTLRFVYFIQHQLGFKNLGLADDEFPTADRLALMPYHREGRRLKGLTRLTINQIAEPFSYGDPLYRTGIAVGDYPIDHHHKKNPKAPQHLGFYPVPSYNIPLGSLIPETHKGLVVAEKGISVSNVVNGTTRLQPVTILTGQAAGTLAALSVAENKAPGTVSIRAVQQKLLSQKAMLLPYLDVAISDCAFEAIQKIGATGILKGNGVPYKWANQTWFYPDAPVQIDSLKAGLSEYSSYFPETSGEFLSYAEAFQLIAGLAATKRNEDQLLSEIIKSLNDCEQKVRANNALITRKELALLLNKFFNPFSKEIDHSGRLRP